MNSKQMHEELNNGIEPLELSIKKWELILERKGFDEGIFNCALCNEHFINFCDDCIIKEKGYNQCKSTPYSEWINHHINKHSFALYKRIECPTCEEIAKKELEFLTSLRSI